MHTIGYELFTCSQTLKHEHYGHGQVKLDDFHRLVCARWTEQWTHTHTPRRRSIQILTLCMPMRMRMHTCTLMTLFCGRMEQWSSFHVIPKVNKNANNCGCCCYSLVAFFVLVFVVVWLFFYFFLHHTNTFLATYYSFTQNVLFFLPEIWNSE